MALTLDAEPTRRFDTTIESPGGDFAEGLETLYVTYGPRIQALCRRMLGSGWGDDAAQETFIRAAHALPRFRTGEPVWPWLATIARNVCRDTARRQGRTVCVPHHPGEDGSVGAVTLESLAGSHAQGPCAEEAADRVDAAERVRFALTRIPPRYGRVLWHRAVEGWSYEELAAAEGVTVASMYVVYRRARHAAMRTLSRCATWFGFLLGLAAITANRLRASAPSVRGRLRRFALADSQLAAVHSSSSFVAVTSSAAMQAAAVVVGLVTLATPATASTLDDDASVALAESSPARFSLPPVLPEEPEPAEPESTSSASPNQTAAPDPEAPAPPQAADTEETAPDPKPDIVPPPVEDAVGDPVTERNYENGNTQYRSEHEFGADVSVDADGDGEGEIEAAPYVFVTCPPPEERGVVKQAACPAFEDADL